MKNKIIRFLKSTDTFISGEEISRNLRISRAAIWKNIEELRKEGYGITAVPHTGYKLEQIPDRLYPREIQDGLKTQQLGQHVVYFDTVGSTMDEAFERARQGAPEGELVIAENQTEGRGRLGRSWVSPKEKGIYFSLILRPALKPAEVARLTLLAGVALAEAISETTGVQPQIKWPNDLLVDGKKIAGILTEMNAETDRVHFCILGIGVNVHAGKAQIPATASSLKILTGKPFNRAELTRHILERLEGWYQKLQKRQFTDILQRWKELSFTLGQKVRIGPVEGKAVDLDEYGALLIQQKDGTVSKQFSGDVEYV